MYKRTPLFMAIALAASSTAIAQTEPNTKTVESLRGDNFSIEEITVTARKRSESLQTVPIAIDAIGEIEMQEKGIASIADVAKYNPSLTYEVGVLPSDTRPAIRGFSNNRGRGNVAILVDGVDISTETLTTAGGGTGANLNLMDLERIEVVKGPQSATYGRSAFSGAVNYITKRPGQEKTANVNMDANEHGRTELGLSFSTPFSDVLAGSINLATTDFDGFYENPNTGGDLGTENSEGVAIALNFTPSDDFSAYFRTEYSEAKYSPRATIMRESTSNQNSTDMFLSGSVGEYGKIVPIPGSGTTQADCNTAAPWGHKLGSPNQCGTSLTGSMGSGSESEIDLSPNPLTGKDYDGTEVRNMRTSLELSWDIGDINVLSLTGYNTNDTDVETDFDLTNYELISAGPGSGAGLGQPGEFTQYGVNTNSDTSFDSFQFSQELRVSGSNDKLDWMVDLLYWKESYDALMNQQWWLRDGADPVFWDSFLAASAGLPPGSINHRTGPEDLLIPMSRNTEHSSIAFALTYHLNDDLRLNLEGRYMEEEIEYSSLPLDTLVHGLWGMPYLDATFMPVDPETQHYDRDDESFTPRVSLDWQVSEDVFTYITYAEGYKPGGMTTTDGNGDIAEGEYDPEKLQTYEIGFKTSWLENRLQLNGAVYQYDYTDQQISLFKTNASGVTSAVTSNAGTSELTGFELEAIYRPSQNWTFTAGYVLSDTKYTDFNLAEIAAETGGSVNDSNKIQAGNAEGDYSGKAFRNSAKNSANVSIRYDGTFNNGVEYFTELYGIYEDKRYLTLENDAYLDAHWLADFNAGVQLDNLQVILYVTNLLDDDTITSGLSNVSYGFLPGGGQAPNPAVNLTLPDPRTVGLRLRYNFF